MNWADNSLRVVMLAEFSDDKTSEGFEKQPWNGSGAVILPNSLRHGVVETVDFCRTEL